jgi:DNA-directed RNA polymerase subunit beta'
MEDVKDPYTEDILVEAGEEISEDHVEKMDKAGVLKVKIRSVLTCKAKRGVCVKCYGRDLARGTTVNLGETVGIIAAQSIGEPGTQLTMRTFHVGGTATRAVEQSVHVSRMDAKFTLEGVSSVVNKDGHLISMNRSGSIVLLDSEGRERDRYPVVYGAKLFFKDGDMIKKGDTLCEWDPYANPIIAEVSGKVGFLGIVEGQTMSEQVDPVTGFATKVITDSKSGDDKPTVFIADEAGNPVKIEGRSTPARYVIPVGAQLLVSDNDEVHSGDVIAKIHREASKTKDITGGLPRVAELFEARKPKEAAIVTEIDGYVSFGKDIKTKQRVIVTPEIGEPREYLIPKGKHFAVREGEFVQAGDALMDGPTNPHDILAVKGDQELAAYMVNEVQEVYRLQGVGINDKHIETIVRQMLRKVTITDPGDTVFLNDMQVEKYKLEEENERVIAEGLEPAKADPLLLGITKVSLSTDSWISAASFQETTKVLTEAAINGKEDKLQGLKENIIMGRLIPAGTGVAAYKKWKLKIEEEEQTTNAILPGLGGAHTVSPDGRTRV